MAPSRRDSWGAGIEQDTFMTTTILSPNDSGINPGFAEQLRQAISWTGCDDPLCEVHRDLGTYDEVIPGVRYRPIPQSDRPLWETRNLRLERNGHVWTRDIDTEHEFVEGTDRGHIDETPDIADEHAGQFLLLLEAWAEYEQAVCDADGEAKERVMHWEGNRL